MINILSILRNSLQESLRFGNSLHNSLQEFLRFYDSLQNSLQEFLTFYNSSHNSLQESHKPNNRSQNSLQAFLTVEGDFATRRARHPGALRQFAVHWHTRIPHTPCEHTQALQIAQWVHHPWQPLVIARRLAAAPNTCGGHSPSAAGIQERPLGRNTLYKFGVPCAKSPQQPHQHDRPILFVFFRSCRLRNNMAAHARHATPRPKTRFQKNTRQQRGHDSSS